MLPGGSVWEIVDSATGERTPAVERPEGVYVESPFREAGGFRLENVLGPPEDPYPYEYPALRVIDLSGNLAPLEFEALNAQLMPDGTLVVLTPPVDLLLDAGLAVVGQTGSSNVFEVDPETGVATFVATARMSPPGYPLAVDDRYIVWTENYCHINANSEESDGRTRIYDRRTGTLTELDQGLWVIGVTPANELAVGQYGPYGPYEIIDLESLSYRVKFPAQRMAWSPDYGHAAVGVTPGGGHGCFA